jgi:hypothetical protein
VALAAIVVVALVQILGIPWGISWTADLGDRVPVIPEGVAALAALPALLIEPFAGAALAERIVSQPSAPPGFMPLLALPLAISPGPALAVAASIRGVRVWRTGLPYALAALGLSVAWIAATLG